MNYNTQLATLNKLLPQAKDILIALPGQASLDDLAAGLAIFLSLSQVGKEVGIVSEGIIRVGHAHLFGVGQIQNNLPQNPGGNLVVVLSGVVDPTTKKPPTLEKLDWFPNGSDLNLVFYPTAGQRFEPTRITHSFESKGFDLILVIGAPSLENLGSIFTGHKETFTSSHIIDVDNKNKTSFGTTNLADEAASSISEVVYKTLTTLGLPLDGDIATNIIAGLFSATSNLQSGNISADTYEVMAACLRLGGQKPTVQRTPVVSLSQFNAPAVTTGVEQRVDFSAQSSPEELPQGEAATTVEPEADWLTPKVFKVHQ